jgi:aspartyl/asparaginyl-tRNA synthetase
VTATLPACSPTTGADARSDLDLALVRIWDAMFRGARAYVERNGFLAVQPAVMQDSLAGFVSELGSVYAETGSGAIELEQPGTIDEVIIHVTGIVQAAAREVIARCSDELALFGRDRDELRNITFARVTHEDAVALVAEDVELGPVFVTRDGASAELLLPRAGCAAQVAAGAEQSGASVDMAHVAQFIVGRERLP